MSCSTMSISYQPYAMSYVSCDRPEKKLFKFPSAPSPDSEASSSYNSPGPLSVGSSVSATITGSSTSTPSNNNNNVSSSKYNDGPGTGTGSGSGPGLGTSSQNSHSLSHPRPHRPSSGHSHSHSHSHSSSNSSATITSPRGGNSSSSSTLTSSSSSGRSTSASAGAASASATSASASATATSSSVDHHQQHQQPQQQHQQQQHPEGSGSGSGVGRSHYLSANCMIFINYHGEVSRVVDEHFSRALSAAYSNDKSTKSLPMSSRPFPPSFWNSNYQPTKPLAGYHGAADFYGAVDYGGPIPGLSQTHDPWHYALPTHQSYHHRPSEIPYPSSSRFNAAQYGSFLLGAGSGTGRFPVSQVSCGVGVKGDGGAWARSYHHDTLSDLHPSLADYSAAAAVAAHSHAAYAANMTAGLETSVQDSSKDLYWF